MSEFVSTSGGGGGDAGVSPSAPAMVVGRVECTPPGRAADEWLWRYLQRSVAELQFAVDAMGERLDALEAKMEATK